MVDKTSMEPSTLLYPVPVVLVSCGNMEENPNIITIGWTGIVCSDPPMVSISIRPHRHSAAIIKESNEFVINIPTEELLGKTDRCGVISGRDHDKFGEVGLTPLKASKVGAPLIKECPVNLECVVKEIRPLGAHDLYIAEVVAASADEDVIQSGKISVSKAMPLVFCPVDSTYWNLSSEVGSYAFTKKLGS
jgi:flavin reductase (DIM6/NTAB) family NADH-FMN oxidoreductase RutF